MAKKKQVFYRLDRVLKTMAHYIMLLGERSNGKSYAVKEHCIEQAFNDENKKFIYLRRWGVDIKGDLIESYFRDAPVHAITKGDYEFISYYRRTLYLSNLDENEKVVRGKVIGYCRELTGEEHYKSGSYLDVVNIIFEEFITKDSYLPREVQKLQSFVSTVARKRKITVFMIGNTISRICPYFSEWQLKNIPKMKQGTIDIYNKKTGQFDEETGEEEIVKIAVELCESSNTISSMFFGESSKMTTTGAWECGEYKHLEEVITRYKTVHRMVIEYDGHRFLLSLLKRNGNYIWYCEPKTTQIQKGTRIISNKIYENYYATTWFYPLNEFEQFFFKLLLQDKIAYSDNLTGSEFKQCLRELDKE